MKSLQYIPVLTLSQADLHTHLKISTSSNDPRPMDSCIEIPNTQPYLQDLHYITTPIPLNWKKFSSKERSIEQSNRVAKHARTRTINPAQPNSKSNNPANLLGRTKPFWPPSSKNSSQVLVVKQLKFKDCAIYVSPFLALLSESFRGCVSAGNRSWTLQEFEELGHSEVV